MSLPISVADVDVTQISSQSEAGLDSRFCEVMNEAPVMIWVSGQDKRCVWFNQPWLTFTGRNMAQELGAGWMEGVHPQDVDRCLQTYVSHFDAREKFRMQYRLRRHDGLYRWIDDTGAPRCDHQGIFLGYIGSCVDIQDFRDTQDDLRHRLLEIAHLNRSVTAGESLASIAHEIRQPLAGIAASANAGLRWLGKEVPDLDKARAAFERINATAHRASNVVETLRAMFKKGDQKRVLLDVNALIREVLMLLNGELLKRHILVKTDLFPQLLEVMADRVQLQQAILNIIMNAMDAMELMTDRLHVLKIMSVTQNSAAVRITIVDSGPGVAPKKINHIFEPFYTTKPQDMGMGLSICRSIIEAHGGGLSASNAKPHGLALKITLPVDDSLPSQGRVSVRAVN